jgi:hypothetical protein
MPNRAFISPREEKSADQRAPGRRPIIAAVSQDCVVDITWCRLCGRHQGAQFSRNQNRSDARASPVGGHRHRRARGRRGGPSSTTSSRRATPWCARCVCGTATTRRGTDCSSASLAFARRRFHRNAHGEAKPRMLEDKEDLRLRIRGPPRRSELAPVCAAHGSASRGNASGQCGFTTPCPESLRCLSRNSPT